jgi:hypothetical protein
MIGGAIRFAAPGGQINYPRQHKSALCVHRSGRPPAAFCGSPDLQTPAARRLLHVRLPMLVRQSA